MPTFAEVKASLLEDVLNTHPSTSTRMAKAMVRTLHALQSEVVPFMEASGSFATQNGIASYSWQTPGMADSFPRNLLRFDRLYYDLGASPKGLVVVDIEEIRFFQESPTAAYPQRVAWFEGALQFGPAPAGAYTVKWDGYRDSTLDAGTGEPITATATQETNPWLSVGEVAYKHLVLSDYYRSDPAATRPDLAQANADLASYQLNSLRAAQKKKSDMGTTARIPNAFSAGLYPEESVSRVALLHPGAPV